MRGQETMTEDSNSPRNPSMIADPVAHMKRINVSSKRNLGLDSHADLDSRLPLGAGASEQVSPTRYGDSESPQPDAYDELEVAQLGNVMSNQSVMSTGAIQKMSSLLSLIENESEKVHDQKAEFDELLDEVVKRQKAR